ncbi:hypothetical protein, partial [Mycobacterium avium]|uniref:hypothetical protein n=1 Tax=Mycobacterium avium TaxID=1764 RepID=UPI001CC52F20
MSFSYRSNSKRAMFRLGGRGIDLQQQLAIGGSHSAIVNVLYTNGIGAAIEGTQHSDVKDVPGSVELRWRSGERQAALTSSLS